MVWNLNDRWSTERVDRFEKGFVCVCVCVTFMVELHAYSMSISCM